MSNIPFIHHLPASVLALAAALILVGCSKKEAATAPAPTVDPAAPTAPAVSAATPDASIPVSTDTRQSLADVDAALKNRAYEKAVQAMLAVQQQKQLTPQQALEAQKRMLALQQNLAGAIASGDPSARAAGEMLRRANMVR